MPWALIELHEPQVLRNHGQTLKQLAERGGLSPVELYCVIRNINLFGNGVKLWITEEDAMKMIDEWIYTDVNISGNSVPRKI
uniref:Uncharacterized protein n=1 Tax=viral metagenome TaxID=1070528 RepID=A0A6M3K8B6_9ZZZZ